MMSLWICLTIFTGAAAGGGGGGGGGGGATRKVISCCLGSASVKMSGSRTSTPTKNACRTNEIVVVLPRFVLSRPPDSIRLSSNIGFSVQPALRTFRHRTSLFCSQARAHSCNGLAAVRLAGTPQPEPNNQLLTAQPHPAAGLQEWPDCKSLTGP